MLGDKQHCPWTLQTGRSVERYSFFFLCHNPLNNWPFIDWTVLAVLERHGAPCVTAVLLDKAVIRAELKQVWVRAGDAGEGAVVPYQWRQSRGKYLDERNRWGPLTSVSEEMESADLKHHVERHKEARNDRRVVVGDGWLVLPVNTCEILKDDFQKCPGGWFIGA